ncbi:MAG: methylated-DNA--[protein]-cysteine S-methyltransferase [Actinomycetota bacterium]
MDTNLKPLPERFVYDSPLGPLAIGLDGGAVAELRFDAGAAPVLPAGHPLCARLDAYFRDGSPLDDVEVQIGGGDFARRVGAVLRTIPAGEVRNYGWVAERAGHPRAARAVGRAVGANPVAILVPCHRVVARNGLGGYGGGLGRKEALLRLEKARRPGSLQPIVG